MRGIYCLLSVFVFWPTSHIFSQTQYVEDYWTPDSSIVRSTGKYKNGQEHGTWKFYYKTGELREELNYTNGLLNGEAKLFYKNIDESIFIVSLSNLNTHDIIRRVEPKRLLMFQNV